jgi:hypothetical protein
MGCGAVAAVMWERVEFLGVCLPAMGHYWMQPGSFGMEMRGFGISAGGETYGWAYFFWNGIVRSLFMYFLKIKSLKFAI